MPEYAVRDIMHPPLRDHYMKHLSAMTGEGLHSKADIAAELAYRDARIEELEAHVETARGIMGRAIDAPEYRQGPRPQHVQDYLDWYRAAPATSLARLKAETIASLRFPTMLRKMWSGGEVQRWLEEQAAAKGGTHDPS